MKVYIDWLIANWVTVAPIALFVLSEALPFIKNTEANGLLEFVINLIKKTMKKPETPATPPTPAP